MRWSGKCEGLTSFGWTQRDVNAFLYTHVRVNIYIYVCVYASCVRPCVRERERKKRMIEHRRKGNAKEPGKAPPKHNKLASGD